MFMVKVIIFAMGTGLILWVSRRSIFNIRQHGFYRFFAWETILILFVLNMNYWFIDPFSPRQLFSWAFLVISLYLIYAGVRMFRKMGVLDERRMEPGLVSIEKTTELVTSGVYRYIRHPFYCSLLFLGWGIFLKHPTGLGGVLVTFVTVMLVVTAKIEENENLTYFGDPYREYMAKSKMFIPHLF